MADKAQKQSCHCVGMATSVEPPEAMRLSTCVGSPMTELLAVVAHQAGLSYPCPTDQRRFSIPIKIIPFIMEKSRP